MQQHNNQVNDNKDLHPIVTIGLLTAGTQLGSALIQRMGRNSEHYMFFHPL